MAVQGLAASSMRPAVKSPVSFPAGGVSCAVVDPGSNWALKDTTQSDDSSPKFSNGGPVDALIHPSRSTVAAANSGLDTLELTQLSSALSAMLRLRDVVDVYHIGSGVCALFYRDLYQA